MNLKSLILLGAALITGAATFAPPAGAETPEQKGLAIAKRVDAFNDGYKGETSTLEMTLVNAHGDRTTRKLEIQQIEVSGEGDRSRIEFQWPADVKGTRMLTWTHRKGNDDQWLYLPAIKRVKRISSGNKSGSFMGSEFAYEDLGSQEVDKYRHKYVGDDKVGGRSTWKIERVPVDSESGYSKLLTWIDQEYMQPLKIDYYDRKGELLKTATFVGYAKQGRWFRPKTLSMVNHQTKKQSHLTWSDRKLEVALKVKEFESDELDD